MLNTGCLKKQVICIKIFWFIQCNIRQGVKSWYNWVKKDFQFMVNDIRANISEYIFFNEKNKKRIANREKVFIKKICFEEIIANLLAMWWTLWLVITSTPEALSGLKHLLPWLQRVPAEKGAHSKSSLLPGTVCIQRWVNAEVKRPVLLLQIGKTLNNYPSSRALCGVGSGLGRELLHSSASLSGCSCISSLPNVLIPRDQFCQICQVSLTK